MGTHKNVHSITFCRVWTWIAMAASLGKIGLAIVIDPTCNFAQNVIPGKSYDVFSPGYPNDYYYGQHSCQWKFTSVYRISLTCYEFYVPASYRCELDDFAVQSGNGFTTHHCNDQTFTITSVGQEMLINFRSTDLTPGGYFYCRVKTFESPNEECNCGWKNPLKIVGGTETGVNEFPNMAGIVQRRIRKIVCGAVIISNFHVLTTAHCVFRQNVTDIGVLVGEHNVKSGTETNATVLFKSDHFDIHHGFDGTNNDIAIITVSGTISFTPLVGPVCLPFRHLFNSFVNAEVLILGWGTRGFALEKSDVLEKAQVRVISLAECRKTYPKVDDDQICTYAPQKDSCQFDSGGPVLWQDPQTQKLVLIGVINAGGFCGDGPGLNIRVGNYIDWIQEKTSDVEYCRME